MVIEAAGMRIPVLKSMPLDQSFDITMYKDTTLLSTTHSNSRLISM